MKTVTFFLIALTFLACTPLVCMEKQSLLSRDVFAQSSGLRGNSSDLLYQLPPTANTSQLIASKPLREMLAMRNPDIEPLLTKEKQEENIALMQSIGSSDIKTKLFRTIALFCGLNCAKDIISTALWGTQPQYPLIDLMPSNHLMPLHPCYKYCFNGCTPPAEPCAPVCDQEWNCNYTPAPIITTMSYPTASSALVNGLAAITATILAVRSQNNKKSAEKKLTALIQELDGLTEASDFCPLPNKNEATPNLATMIDGQMAQHEERKEQESIKEEREKMINFIKSHGTFSSATKMWFLLGVLFGINGAKDFIISQIWGYDLTFPLTPLIPPNDLLPVTQCRQLCWQNGCCGMDCMGEPCMTGCDGWKCDYETPVLNTLGKTSLAGLVANFAGLVASWSAACYCLNASSKKDQELKKLLEKLDTLIANADQANV